MKYLYVLLLLTTYVSYGNGQSFTKESDYLSVRLMDVKLNEWKPSMLDEMEKRLDAELKYSDLKKGIECKSIDFEQEVGYPKQDARFLDLSIRGLCRDVTGKLHTIDKQLMTVAIERHLSDMYAVTSGTVYKIGNVQIYKRNRNKLNLIIIPLSLLLIILIFSVTFALRQYRHTQKRRHIVEQLEKKREAASKRSATVANPDPYATDNDRLLQLDPTVVGSVSNTLGSPKGLTSEPYLGSNRTNAPTTDSKSEQKGTPTKDNRAVKAVSDGNKSFQTPYTPPLYENETKLLPTHSQPQYEQQYGLEMMPVQDQQPRVVVKTIRGDGSSSPYYNTQEGPAGRSVSIPVQIEQAGPQQRHNLPPYHSDPYYRQDNV